MNIKAKPKEKLRILAKHIGPIMSLDAELSDKKQNLIFAKNGTGKSFLARSLRFLDKSLLEDVTHEEMIKNLVSEEAPEKQGTFQLYEGEDCIGSIDLCDQKKPVKFSPSKYIFHVFSEDYVDLHLRQKSYELDGEPQHAIIVGQENQALDEKEAKMASKKKELEKSKEKFDEDFKKRKKQLDPFSISRLLRNFKDLNSGRFLNQSQSSNGQPAKTLAELLKDFNKLQSLPNDPKLPSATELKGLGLDWDAISLSLAKITSPSSVAEEVKTKISTDPNFFRVGLKLRTTAVKDCPFCMQSLNEAAQQALSKYQEYFKDAEAKEKDTLAQLEQNVEAALSKLETWSNRHLTAKSDFDQLKSFFPSMLELNVEDENAAFKDIKATLISMQNALRNKKLDLSSDQTIATENAASQYNRLEEICNLNSDHFKKLAKLVISSADERKSIQNQACKAFSFEFGESESAGIDAINTLTEQIENLKGEINELQQTQGNKVDARSRVAKTFMQLLNRFFSTKYSFNPDTFKVLRKQKNMARGIQRTMSDGEKSVMAFCYYIAQSHLKVDSNNDYERLYFVFDDPVSSMSHDYVYTVAQTLKLLKIGAAGEIEFNSNSKHPRPRMLILTHNNYFYNIASSNNVIDKDGLFQLVPGATDHKLSNQKGFVTPHQQQLQHVFNVSVKKVEPSFMTPNSIRSVLESMWKFCRPDIDNFSSFSELLATKYKIELKSTLINDLSHGGEIYDVPDMSEDIVLAAEEAISVVKLFAKGQIKRI